MKKMLLLFTVILFCSCSTMRLVGKKGEAVDLGLSVLWADRNIGAEKPTDCGRSLAWSIKSSKKHCDVPSRMWGKEWHTPTEEQINEIISRCKWTWQENPRGYMVEGSTGNRIFFPFRDDEKIQIFGYWSATRFLPNPQFCVYMYFNEKYPDTSYTPPFAVKYVRPVKAK